MEPDDFAFNTVDELYTELNPDGFVLEDDIVWEE